MDIRNLKINNIIYNIATTWGKVKGNITEQTDLQNALKLSNIYSDEEHIVGKWKDGSYIYSKTITISNKALQLGSNNIYFSEISNFKCCIKVELTKLDQAIFPYINTDGTNMTFTYIAQVYSNYLNIRCNRDTWGAQNTWYATLYYLKNEN